MAYPHALQTALFRAGRSATGAVLGRRAAHYTQAALAVDPDKRRRLCADCAVTVVRENFDAGRKAAQRPESVAKRAATQRMYKQAIQDWKPSDQLGWLTREVYVKRVQAALASVAKSRIRSALGVSEPYSSDIQAGKRVPHPRHWQALAQLVGVSSNV